MGIELKLKELLRPNPLCGLDSETKLPKHSISVAHLSLQTSKKIFFLKIPMHFIAVMHEVSNVRMQCVRMIDYIAAILTNQLNANITPRLHEIKKKIIERVKEVCF